MIIVDCEQRTPEWFKARLGVITASDLAGVFAKKGTQTRITSQLNLIAEIDTRQPPEEFSAKATAWGVEHESDALAAFEFVTGNVAKQVGFIYYDESKRFGCSPDGLIDDKIPLELKCPISSRYHIQAMLMDKIKPEYYQQVQMQIAVTDAPYGYFASFDPRSRKPIHVIKIERDDDFIANMMTEVEKYCVEVDAALEKLGLKFGDQWK